MAKARGLETKLARLRAIGKEDAAPGHLAELRGFLGDKSNIVVAEAAEIVGGRMLADFAPDLVGAFQRFMIDPVETDMLCRAKIAIMESLNKIEYDDDATFLTGFRHVQPEPGWGGSSDTAAPLRGASAFGLVRIHHRGVVLLLAELLADPEKIARQNAAQALGAVGSEAAIALLRFKAKAGDKDPEVIGDCLTALMTAEPKESLAFVAKFLDSRAEGIAEGAALALAESRRPEAFEILKKHWPSVREESLQNVLLLGISITRLPPAIDFLLEILAGKDEAAAAGALSALAIHKHNPVVKERIAAVVKKQNLRVLQEGFSRSFGGT